MTNASNFLAAPTMASALNQWNANANLVGLDTFVTNPFVVQDVMRPQDFAPNLVNVGVVWDGLDLNARLVCLTLAAKMDSANNLGNVNVLEIM